MAKIIAEVCQNHLGRRDVLKSAIKEAAAAGADYIKTQVIFSEDLTFRERFEEGMVEGNGVVKTIKRPYDPEYRRLSSLDLSFDDYKWFVEEATRNNIKPMVTAFSRNRIEFIEGLPWTERIIKVASYDCASYVLIKELCRSFEHLVISTGSSFDHEIEEAANTVIRANKKLTFMHCVTSYPNTPDMCNLNRMKWLRQYTDSVGWSDHTLVERDGIKASKIALMMGADMIERHFTVEDRNKTKDGPVSVSPSELRELVEFSRLDRNDQEEIVKDEIPDWNILMGFEKREMTHTEMLNRDYYRGRFASKVYDEWVYNWEDKSVVGNKENV